VRENFSWCAQFVVRQLEGKATDDPDDPGGFTIWGLASKYNPEVTRDMTYEQALPIFFKRYWQPAGCNDAPWPMDFVLFDGAVNPQDDPALPGVGNQELLSVIPDPNDWKRFLIERMARYGRRSNLKYIRGHIARCHNLTKAIEERKIT
jgi:hypothetical protein